MFSEICGKNFQVHRQIQRGTNFAEESVKVELWNIQTSALHPTGSLNAILAIIFCVTSFNFTHVTFGGVVEIIRIRIYLPIFPSVDTPFHVFTCDRGLPQAANAGDLN